MLGAVLSAKLVIPPSASLQIIHIFAVKLTLHLVIYDGAILIETKQWLQVTAIHRKLSYETSLIRPFQAPPMLRESGVLDRFMRYHFEIQEPFQEHSAVGFTLVEHAVLS